MEDIKSLQIQLNKKVSDLHALREKNKIMEERKLIKFKIKEIKKQIKDEKPSITNKIKNRWRAFIDG